jgi:Protein of unknown function (DUF5674)
MIHIIRERATKEQLQEMLEIYKEENYIKLAVDVELGIAAGGGEMHYECEEVLLEAGSKQQNVWGAGWLWQTKEVRFDSYINIRPPQNRNLELQDPVLRGKVGEIVLRLFDGVEP